ncbi:hypothetical protein FDB23_03320 [Clostridium botulinum]|nr:hypothetical protein [Clostridium botulinum]
MKAYKVYEQDQMGYEDNIEYAKSYNKVIQLFNQKVKKTISDIGGDIVDKYDFGEQIASFRKWNEGKEVISRKYPYLLYKDKNLLVAQIFYWERTSYEYSEYDIVNSMIVLEGIEILE